LEVRAGDLFRGAQVTARSVPSEGRRGTFGYFGRRWHVLLVRKTIDQVVVHSLQFDDIIALWTRCVHVADLDKAVRCKIFVSVDSGNAPPEKARKGPAGFAAMIAASA
jgi:hypothetical protein